jgi:pimeloyl-ACP methyl ester carboxylesterase
MPFVTTPTLKIAFEQGGPTAAPAVILLHGWPDDPRTFDAIAPTLQAAGLRTIAPWLRGFGPTSFVSKDTMRSGEIVAMAQDVLDLADALGLETFSVIGHDWGARIAYALAAVHPERISRICAISVAWQPGELPTPGFEQARMYWYQWFMATKRGEDAVRRDPKGFARAQWDTWAPRGWFEDTEFEATAKSFENPHWVDITLHSYRVRWGEAAKDPRYRAFDERAKAVKSISVPALVIHGTRDGATLPSASGDQGKYFVGGFARHLLEGVGHFPTREAPDKVVSLLTPFLGSNEAKDKGSIFPPTSATAAD